MTTNVRTHMLNVDKEEEDQLYNSVIAKYQHIFL